MWLDISKISKVGSNGNIFATYKEKFIATAFVFNGDAKHSDMLWGSSNVCCYFVLGGCGQKWVHPFRS